MSAETKLEQLRKNLHTVVDGAWAQPDMLDAKDALSAVARAAIEECYEGCLTGTNMQGKTNAMECLRECARQAKLGDKFREKWGKKKS